MDVQKQQYAEFMHSRTQLCVSCRTDLTATFTKEDVSGGVDKGTPEAVEKV